MGGRDNIVRRGRTAPQINVTVAIVAGAAAFGHPLLLFPLPDPLGRPGPSGRITVSGKQLSFWRPVPMLSN